VSVGDGLLVPGAPITLGFVFGVVFGCGFCNSVGVGVLVCGLPSGTGCGTVVVRDREWVGPSGHGKFLKRGTADYARLA